jgi:hypothetical protein
MEVSNTAGAKRRGGLATVRPNFLPWRVYSSARRRILLAGNYALQIDFNRCIAGYRLNASLGDASVFETLRHPLLCETMI